MIKTHHIGYLVKSMEDSRREFLNLGYTETAAVVYDESRKINICFLENAGVVVELVEPDEDCDFLKGLKKKIGVGAYHICYECDDFEKDIKRLSENGYLVVQEAAVAPAINGRKVAFLYAPDMGVIELLEK